MFDPQIVKKLQSSVGNFADTVVSLYARGMTTREIEDYLREMYSAEISLFAQDLDNSKSSQESILL
jgi:transposase-like protein